MVYTKLSDIIFRHLLLPNGVEEKNKAVYMYGLEVLISSQLNLLIVLILSFFLGISTEMLCFFLTFVPLRLYGHGAHASTHTRCLMLFTVCMLTSISIGSLLVNTNFYVPVILFGLICCLFIQYRFSTDKSGHRRYKCQTVIHFSFPWLFCLLTGVALFTSFEPKYTVIGALGIYVQSISLILKKERKNYENNHHQITTYES